MKLVAISVGRPQDVQWRGRDVRTSIFKTPVQGRVHVARDNVEGDQTLYATDSANRPLLESASSHPSLPASWREHFRNRLWAPDA
jgi:hypothetical protein